MDKTSRARVAGAKMKHNVGGSRARPFGKAGFPYNGWGAFPQQQQAKGVMNVGALPGRPGFAFDSTWSSFPQQQRRGAGFGSSSRRVNVGALQAAYGGMSPGRLAPTYSPQSCYDPATRTFRGGSLNGVQFPASTPANMLPQRGSDGNYYYNVAGDNPWSGPACGGGGTSGGLPGGGPRPGYPAPRPQPGDGGGGYVPRPVPNPQPGGGNGGYMPDGGFSGWPGFGYGAQPCAGPTPPQIPMGRDGCPVGWLQCKQPIPATALALAAGASTTIVVTPRRTAQPYEFLYVGPATTFTIDSVEIDGTDYLDGAIPADAYLGTVTDLSVSWAEFSSTTPLNMTITNFSGGAASFRGVLQCAVARA